MDRNTIEKKVKRILAEILDAKELDLNVSLAELGIDSLDAIELMTRIETEFEISLPSDIYKSIKTGKNIVGYLEEHLSS